MNFIRMFSIINIEAKKAPMIEVVDIRGKNFAFEKPPVRIISLVPSLTETLTDLGCADRIAGCTRYCTGITGFSGSTIVGGPVDPDVDLVRSLEPDLVLAGTEENRKEDVEAMDEFSTVLVCRPVTVDDVAKLVSDIGSICGAEDRAGEYVSRIIDSRKSLNEYAEGRKRISFIYLVWWNPAMVAGENTYISGLLEEGPFSNAFGNFDGYPEITRAAIGEIKADVVFLPSEPYDFTDETIEKIRKISGDTRIVRMDGRMCGWYGTRTASGLPYIRDLHAGLAGVEG